MKIATYHWAILGVGILALGILFDSARADSIVHFTYSGSVTGSYDVQVYSSPTPVTAKNFLRYVNGGKYNNSILHYNTPIQSTEPKIISGGSFLLDEPANQEAYPTVAPLSEVQPYGSIVNEPGISNLRGTIAMAKESSDPNSAANQWYVNLGNNSVTRDSLNGGYTVFGKILGNGMDFFDNVDVNYDQFNMQSSYADLPHYLALSDVPLYNTPDYTHYSYFMAATATVIPAAWNAAASTGDWSNAANWSGIYATYNCVPDGAGSKIVLQNATASGKTVNMASVGRTVGSITFGGTGGTTIAGNSQVSLTLDNIDKTAEITVVGNHTIGVPVVLAGDVTISGTGTLNMTGGISGAHALQIADGTLNAASIQVSSLTIGVPPVVIMQAEWKGGSSGNPTDWSQPENWNPSGIVGSPGCHVTFGNQPAGNNQVDLKTADQTVGSITFAGTSTTIMSSAQHSLTLNNLANAAVISVSGNHTISVPVVLGGDANISGSGTLSMTGGISGAHALNVSGALNASSIQVNSLVIGGATPTAAVPEPSAAMLFCLAVAGLFACGWRRKK